MFHESLEYDSRWGQLSVQKELNYSLFLTQSYHVASEDFEYNTKIECLVLCSFLYTVKQIIGICLKENTISVYLL